MFITKLVRLVCGSRNSRTKNVGVMSSEVEEVNVRNCARTGTGEEHLTFITNEACCRCSVGLFSS